MTSMELRRHAQNFNLLGRVAETNAAYGTSDTEIDAWNRVVFDVCDAVDALTAAAERIEERDGMRLPLHGVMP